ncbi:MAG: Ig-like domain-containing protein [Bacteroidota bacterium]
MEFWFNSRYSVPDAEFTVHQTNAYAAGTYGYLYAVEGAGSPPPPPVDSSCQFVQQNDGLVVMEAENFQANTAQGGKSFVQTIDLAGFSGDAAMTTTPNSGTNQNSGYEANSPRLDFRIQFVQSGTHYIWLRTHSQGSGGDDSFHAGLNGIGSASADRISANSSSFIWGNGTMDGPVASVDVPAAGIHTFNLWMREDGATVDKIILTTDPNYTPSGIGPNEQTTGNCGDSIPDLIPVTGLSFTAPVDSLEAGGSASYLATVIPANASDQMIEWSSSDPTVGSIDAQGLLTALQPGTTIVRASSRDGGFADSALLTVLTPSSNPNCAFEQENGGDGLVVIEAENHTDNVSQGGKDFVLITTLNGFSGTGAMISSPNTGTNQNSGYESNSPRLDFEIEFTQAGTHYVWLRMHSQGGGGDDSFHAGLDGSASTSADRISINSNAFSWTRNTMDGPVATVDVANPGTHTLNIWMREDGAALDKIILTTNNNFSPTGTGPTESNCGGGIAVSGVNISAPQTSLELDSSLTLSATIVPANATEQGLMWSSSDVSVLSVNTQGELTGLKAGTSWIRVVTNDGGFADSVLITVENVNPPASVRWVTNSDGGNTVPGSFRQVLSQVQAGEVIWFEDSLTGKTIVLTDQAIVNDSIEIDGQNKNISLSGGNSNRILLIRANGVRLRDVRFVNGNTTDGAVKLDNDYNNLSVVSCRFEDNVGTTYDGGAFKSYNGSGVFIDCLFEDNAGAQGGAVYHFGPFDFVRCTFRNNSSALEGGAVYAFGQSRFVNCFFDGNQAATDGGAIRFYSPTSGLVANCIFDGNSAGDEGGAIVGHSWSGGEHQIINNTFVANTAAIANGGGAIYDVWSINVQNNVFWGNTANGLVNHLNTDRNTANNAIEAYTGSEPGNISLSSNPLINGSYELLSTAPCINLGINAELPTDFADLDNDGDLLESLALDYADQTRIVSGTVDMGAVEYDGSSRQTIDPLATDLRVKVYPNPLSGQKLQIELSGFQPGPAEVRVHDVHGRLVQVNQMKLSAGSNQYSLSLHLSAGVYSLEVVSGGQRQQVQLMVL